MGIYDVAGRLVREVAGGAFPAGYQSAIWDGLDERGRELASGTYFLRLRSGGLQESLELVVVR